MHAAPYLWFALTVLRIGRAASETVPAAAAVNQLGFGLLREHRRARPTGNVVFSPITISSTFAMVYAGARGRTKTQLEDVFLFQVHNFGPPGIIQVDSLASIVWMACVCR